MDTLRGLANKALALASHANLAIDVIRATFGNVVPEDAHKLAKLIGEAGMGGKDSWVDEARMASIKLNKLTKNELKTLRGLDAFVATEYGDGFFGNMMEKRYGNKLRPGLLHLSTPTQNVVDKIGKVVGKQTVHDEIVRSVPGNDDDLVVYLKDLVREIRSATRSAAGTPEEKMIAGYRHGLTILKSDGFPDLQLAEFAKIADAAIEALPDAARATARKIRGATAEVTRVVAVHSPRVQAAIKADARAINQAIIDRSDRIDARPWYHPLRLFGW